jgi:predicted nucleic acid-binding protein
VVLIDTSVWVDHLRLGNSALTELLFDAKVVCHPFVVGELACGTLRNRSEILALLQTLPSIPEIAHEDLLRFVESHRLMGQGLGFIDVHLLASARLAAIPLWTMDRRLRQAATALAAAYR